MVIVHHTEQVLKLFEGFDRSKDFRLGVEWTESLEKVKQFFYRSFVIYEKRDGLLRRELLCPLLGTVARACGSACWPGA